MIQSGTEVDLGAGNKSGQAAPVAVAQRIGNLEVVRCKLAVSEPEAAVGKTGERAIGWACNRQQAVDNPSLSPGEEYRRRVFRSQFRGLHQWLQCHCRRLRRRISFRGDPYGSYGG